MTEPRGAVNGRAVGANLDMGRVRVAFVADERFDGAEKQASATDDGFRLPAKRWRIADASSIALYPARRGPEEEVAGAQLGTENEVAVGTA